MIIIKLLIYRKTQHPPPLHTTPLLESEQYIWGPHGNVRTTLRRYQTQRMNKYIFGFCCDTGQKKSSNVQMNGPSIDDNTKHGFKSINPSLCVVLCFVGLVVDEAMRSDMRCDDAPQNGQINKMCRFAPFGIRFQCVCVFVCVGPGPLERGKDL